MLAFFAPTFCVIQKKSGSSVTALVFWLENAETHYDTTERKALVVVWCFADI